MKLEAISHTKSCAQGPAIVSSSKVGSRSKAYLCDRSASRGLGLSLSGFPDANLHSISRQITIAWMRPCMAMCR
jgi:hypothetical protein